VALWKGEFWQGSEYKVHIHTVGYGNEVNEQSSDQRGLRLHQECEVSREDIDNLHRVEGSTGIEDVVFKKFATLCGIAHTSKYAVPHSERR